MVDREARCAGQRKRTIKEKDEEKSGRGSETIVTCKRNGAKGIGKNNILTDREYPVRLNPTLDIGEHRNVRPLCTAPVQFSFVQGVQDDRRLIFFCIPLLEETRTRVRYSPSVDWCMPFQCHHLRGGGEKRIVEIRGYGRCKDKYTSAKRSIANN